MIIKIVVDFSSLIYIFFMTFQNRKLMRNDVGE